MNSYIFLKTQRKQLIDLVCKRAGTNYGWFRQMAHGHGTPSVELAVALEESSRHYAVAKSDVMTAEEILKLDVLLSQRVRAMNKVDPKEVVKKCAS